nr:MAG: Putative amidoligase enzyme [Bacteriophage sp.]
MSYLPIIRFKNRWQTFDLNLHYPYSVNGKIIKYTHLGYRGDACYIVDNECNTYYLPHDYAEIINDALKLHSNIYHECDTDSCRRQIITKLENINRREYGWNDFELFNSVLAEQSRNGNYYHDRILYDTTCNKAYVYNCNETMIGAIRLCHLEPSDTQRGRRSEVIPISFSFNNSERNIGFINNIISNKTKTYIHQFNYVPKYIKHFMPGESEDTTLLLGAEIEVGGNNNISSDNDKNSTVKKCIQIMNGSDSDEENLIYSTHDSTVQIEFDTMPCSLEFHKNKMNYREMFEYLDKEGYKGHDCETAGLHIHANRSYLGKSRISQELVISKILYILEKFNDEICVIARRDNEYSEFVGSKKEENSLVELYGKYKDHGKRAALNLQHKDTIEFRMFKSTLKYETFILTLEFVKDIIDYAKSASIEEIELIKWADLMKLFSPALRNYYTERYNKQYKKTMNEDETLLKRQISNIKKAILNCKNYMMKTKLQQEYDELRRQYNKIHKKNKRKKAYSTVTHVDSRIDGFTSAGAYSQSGELIYRF